MCSTKRRGASLNSIIPYTLPKLHTGKNWYIDFKAYVNPEKPDVPLNKNDAFQKVQKRRVQEKR